MTRIVFFAYRERLMNTDRFIGVVLIILGAMLLYFGYTDAQSVGEPIAQTFRGRLTDSTTWYVVSGIASAFSGVVLLTLRMRSRAADRLAFGKKVLP